MSSLSKEALVPTATTTSQIKNSIVPIRKNKRAARAARTLEQIRAVLCKTTESLRFDDGNVNDNATNQWFDWLNEEK